MKNTIKIKLKIYKEVLRDLKKIINKELICINSYYSGRIHNTNEHHFQDYADVWFMDSIENISRCSITFDSIFLQDYNLLCQKIQMHTTWELGKRANLSLILHGVVMATPQFRVAKIEIFGAKYECESDNGNQFKVDMDTFMVFTSLAGEQILIRHTDQPRMIQVSYDKSQIQNMLNESNKKDVKTHVLQALID